MDDGLTTQSGYLVNNFGPLNLNRYNPQQKVEEEPGFFGRIWEGMKVGWTPADREPDVYDSWNNQIRQELELPQIQRDILAETSFSPLETMGLGEAASNMALTGAIDSIGDFFRKTDNSSEKLETAGNFLDLYGQRVGDRANAVGSGRAFAELMAPAAGAAVTMVPLGAGFRMLPHSVRTSRIGSTILAPNTSRAGKGVEFLFNRAVPGAYIANAATGQIPGQTNANLAPEVAGYGGFMATYGLGSVIKNRLGPAGKITGALSGLGTIGGGIAGGIGTSVAVGNVTDRQRVDAGRRWAFQDQERLDWAWDEHPEWFPEFQR